MNHGVESHATFVDAVLRSAQGQTATCLHRAVVTRQYDDRVVAQPTLVEFSKNSGDVVVQRVQHAGVMMLLFGARLLVRSGEAGGMLGICPGEVDWLGLQRCVSDVKWNIAEKRTVFIFPDELNGMMRDEVVGVAFILWSEIEIVPPTHGTVAFHRASRKVVSTPAIIDPCFVEAVCVGTLPRYKLLVGRVFKCLRESGSKGRRIRVITVVPLAKNPSTVAVRLEAFGDGCFLRRQFSTDFRPSANAKRMPPRKQHCASRRADAPAHELRHFDPLLKQSVDIRCRNAAAVGTDVAPAEVVCHDIDDVGFGGFYFHRMKSEDRREKHADHDEDAFHR